MRLVGPSRNEFFVLFGGLNTRSYCSSSKNSEISLFWHHSVYVQMLDRKQQKQQLVLIPAHCFCVAAGTDVEMQSLESVPAVPVHLLHTSTSDIWINVSAAFWNPNLSKTATSRVKTDMVFKRLFGDDWQELSSFLNKNNTERLKQNPWHAFSFS